ncbi:MAG: PA14 domain-containing protein [Bryobacteraceae bacterium]|nr:PA14 domain-containing protein [Bryobacteraceae bacterium]
MLSLFALALFAQQTGHPVFGVTTVIPGGLKGDIYHLSENTQSLDILTSLKPVGSIYTHTLNIPPQDFSFGFPGVTDRFEWFAVDYRGKFWIETPGMYRFRLVSDDGALLFIDDQLIVDNDGVHSPAVRLASLRLSGGMHTIRVAYFQGPAHTVALTLEIAPPGGQAKIFSTEEFKPPSDPEAWRFAAHPPTASDDPMLARYIPPRIDAPVEKGKRRKRR